MDITNGKNQVGNPKHTYCATSTIYLLDYVCSPPLLVLVFLGYPISKLSFLNSGDTPQFEGVREQRVTGICVFLLTGLSVTLAPILLYIPMPVLYGVLMYMGVNTLKGMQFIDRIFLIFMPVKHQPDYSYLRHVPLKKVHLFTFIQAGSLAALWIIKSTPASLVFPLMVSTTGLKKTRQFDKHLVGNQY